MRSTSQPFSGSISASASRYPLVTHWITGRVVCRSVARLESETLTTVASSSARNEPSEATVTIFQIAGSSGSDARNGLGKCFQNLVCRADPGKAREGFRERKAMLVRILSGTGIFDGYK